MLSIKQIGTICLSILIPTFSAFATPDIASNSNGNGSCVEPVLHRYDGSANLQAGWQANTIQLKWYNGDTQLDVQDAADSCTYDGALTLPSTQPTKTGYTFAGWRVKTGSAAASNACFVGPVCGLTSSLAATDGEHYWAKGEDEGDPACLYDNFGTECSDSAFTSLNTHEWKVEFSHGVVEGTASCNNNPEGDLSVLELQREQIWAQFEAGTITEEEAMAQYIALQSQKYSFPGMCQPTGTFSSSSTGQYCWCHAESYTPTGGAQCSLSSLAWVYISFNESADVCAYRCADDCASNAWYDPDFRAALFGVAGN